MLQGRLIEFDDDGGRRIHDDLGPQCRRETRRGVHQPAVESFAPQHDGFTDEVVGSRNGVVDLRIRHDRREVGERECSRDPVERIERNCDDGERRRPVDQGAGPRILRHGDVVLHEDGAFVGGVVDDRAVPLVEHDFDHLVIDSRRHFDLDWIPPGARPSDEVREEPAFSPLGEGFVDDGLLIDSESGVGRIEDDVDTVHDERCWSLDEKLFVGLDRGGRIFRGVPGYVDPAIETLRETRSGCMTSSYTNAPATTSTKSTGMAIAMAMSMRRKRIPVSPSGHECMAEHPLCNDLRSETTSGGCYSNVLGISRALQSGST